MRPATERGRSAFDMRIGIIACGAVVRELIAIARRQGWTYELTAVPASLHNRPARIAPAVERKLAAWLALDGTPFDLVLVGYADCGTQGALDDLLECYPEAVRVPGPHCYEFFGGNAFAASVEEEPGTFYLTDFLARHFEGLVWRGLGLDRFPQLLPDYFGYYRRVVYLRQTQAPETAAHLLTYAQAAADRLGLPLQIVDTGVDSLEARLIDLVAQRRRQLMRARQVDEPEAAATSDGGEGRA